MYVPLSEPDITELEIDAVAAVLRSTHLSLGPKMEEFEARVASYAGMPHGIAVSSGTAGLHLCVRAMGIGAGDEVIVPSFTFIAAANALRYEGAVPVFTDIDADTLNLDPSLIEAAITPRTKAVMMVHTFGCPVDVEAILAIARRHKLFVIEDACEALGATHNGKQAGSFGDAAVFAFYPNKQITTGEGGMVVTENEELARHIRALRNQGRYPTDAWHQHSELGFNYRLSEMNCALGCAQMQRLHALLSKRRTVARWYDDHLRDVNNLRLPPRPRDSEEMSWFVYVVRLTELLDPDLRDHVASALLKAGVQCGRYFAPIHQQKAYKEWAVPHPLPVTEAESRRTLALPFFSKMTEAQVAYVAQVLHEVLANLHLNTDFASPRVE